MREHCHRCHGELPDRTAANPYDDDGALLFCPRCGAPQLLLQEHMRAETQQTDTTGAMPPPRPAAMPGAVIPGQIDWRAALSAGALVAVVGAMLELIGLQSGAALFLTVLWTMCGAVIALGLYARHRPQAWMDARVGLRVGLTTGLVLVAALTATLAATGVVMRFGTHSLSAFDEASARELATTEAMAADWIQLQSQPPEIQQKFHGWTHAPEVRAGNAIFRVAFLAILLVAISAGGGAFAGMMRASQSPRPGLRRGD